MALKGTTKIELTNVKTGEKEVIEKDNLVTNAVASILGENPFAWQLKSNFSTGTFLANMIPLCPNLFGGILLFENAIPEEENRFFAQSDNPVVGYSSSNVNDKTDILRGSMNLNESGALDSHDGYRFVFDFTTAQANGTISALGMTSKWGGMSGYGSNEWANTQSPNVFRKNASISSISAGYIFKTLLHYDEETGIATSMYVSSQKTITVTRVLLHTKDWRLIKWMDPTDTAIIDTQTIETTTFASATVTGTERYYHLCDGGDGYVWGFEHSGNAKGNSSGSATLNWIKIKLDDLSFEEGTWTIGAKLYPMGERYADVIGYGAKTYEKANCVVLDGCLYCIDYNKSGLYRINLANITDIKYIGHPDGTVQLFNTTSTTSAYYREGAANLIVVGNRVCMWNGWLNGETIVKNAFNINIISYDDEFLHDGWINNTNIAATPFRNSTGMYALKLGPMSLHYNASRPHGSGYKTNIHARLLLAAPYLATINNLPTPVQKTADKTMKITYILREES